MLAVKFEKYELYLDTNDDVEIVEKSNATCYNKCVFVYYH